MIWIMAIISIVALFLLTGCKKPVKPEPEPDITEVKLLVPYEKMQGKNWCLPASGAMILKYYGENISQTTIANKIIVNGDASTYRMVIFAREAGFIADWKRKSMGEIEDYLRQALPLIVIQQYNSTLIKESHARVIIGFDSVKQELTLHDSIGKNNYKMSYKAFFELGFDGSEMSKIIIIRR